MQKRDISAELKNQFRQVWLHTNDQKISRNAGCSWMASASGYGRFVSRSFDFGELAAIKTSEKRLLQERCGS